MFFYRTPTFIKWLYPQLTWSMPSDEKNIYLTFDDGPVPDLTPHIIKVLSEFDAKATFFCVGDNLRKYPDIARQATGEGHSLGNHTFNHIKGWSIPNDEYITNVQLCEHQLEQFSTPKALFRPPYGKIKRSQIKVLTRSYNIIMWDVLTMDYKQKIEKEHCLKNSIAATRPGSIVLFHDNKKAEKNMKYTLPRYIEHFSNLGYCFKAL